MKVMKGSYLDKNKALKEDFYLQETEIVAKNLINKILVRILPDYPEPLAARIVETEAYLDSGDKASHSAPGQTKRNAPMFAKGGILYVYKIYGIHHCVNVVTKEEGFGSAVLLRAGEPLSGIEKMKEHRSCGDIMKLCKGPGNLARSFGFDLSDNYSKLTGDDLYITDKGNIDDSMIGCSERVGISKSEEFPLRFFLIGSNYVSSNKIKKL
ncbi:MAG: DNA-3-methyladenine glycosylase [Bacteroidota bacterium]|nr:DNA-3-methyladenine glycosylase [Bacteroidota bacterium]